MLTVVSKLILYFFPLLQSNSPKQISCETMKASEHMTQRKYTETLELLLKNVFSCRSVYGDTVHFSNLFGA